jgi:hypothetical protein
MVVYNQEINRSLSYGSHFCSLECCICQVNYVDIISVVTSKPVDSLLTVTMTLYLMYAHVQKRSLSV